MGLKHAYVCDVCGKEKPTTNSYYSRDDYTPDGWYGIRHGARGVHKLACSLTCLRDWPSPAPKKAPAKKAAAKKRGAK